MKKQTIALTLAAFALSGVFAGAASAEMSKADHCVTNYITTTPRADGKILLDIKAAKLACEKQTGTKIAFYTQNSAMKANK